MINIKRIAKYENFINGQEQVIQALNKITPAHADMDVKAFMEMYNDTKEQLVTLKSKPKRTGNIEACFEEEMFNDMFNDMSDMSEYGSDDPDMW